MTSYQYRNTPFKSLFTHYYILFKFRVSPLMGPIMAFTFGAMIRDRSLIKTGVISELWGLFICVIVGFVSGVFVESKPIQGPWSSIDRWPTSEMFSRTQLRGLVIGAAIAIPSGGVALSILAGNSGSLVGVAISASLLPPCVNGGILYGMALVIAVEQIIQGHNPLTLPCNMQLRVGSPWRKHPILYCQNSLIEYGIMGTISLCLTLLNIILIFLTGLVVLKIKEVAPYTSRTALERFWKHDLRQARDFNKMNNGYEDLLKDIEDNPSLLTAVEDDYVFNRVRNRGWQTEENIFDRVKGQRTKQVEYKSDGGWFNWFSSGSKKDDEEAFALKRIKSKSEKIL